MEDSERIIVVTLGNQNITVLTNPETKVIDVKRQIAEQSGKPVENIRIIVNGHCEDNCKLIYLEILKGTALRAASSLAKEKDEALLQINYLFSVLPTNCASERDEHHYRILCKGTKCRTHNVSEKNFKLVAIY